jgi:hypothetical protein
VEVIDPSWVTPVNTALSIVLVVVTAVVRRDQRRTKRELLSDVHDVKKKVGANRRTADEAQDELVRHDLEKHGPVRDPPES